MRFSDLRTRCSWLETITSVINHESKLRELKSRDKELSRVSQVYNYISSKINRVSVTGMMNRLSLIQENRVDPVKEEEEDDEDEPSYESEL